MAGFGVMLGQVLSSVGALDRVFKILDYKPRIVQEFGKKVIDIQGNISFKKVNFSYPKKDIIVLKDIDLDIKSG